MDQADEFMERAIELSQDAVERGAGGPFGAVIVRAGQVIAGGHNQVLELGDPTAHAEVMAIRAACRVVRDFRLEGCELYTSCEPCPMCLGAIYWARLDRVYFANTRAEAAAIGFDDAELYAEFGRPVAHRKIPFVRLAIASAIAPMRAWESKVDRTDY